MIPAKFRENHPLQNDEITLSFTDVGKSRKEGKDQKSIQSRTTPDTGYQWESDNVTIRHHKQEPRYQPFPSR